MLCWEDGRLLQNSAQALLKTAVKLFWNCRQRVLYPNLAKGVP